MNVELRILRYDPERASPPLAEGKPSAGVPETEIGPKPYWQTFQVEASPMDRVLDLMIRIKAEQDGSLSFRRSCGHGICGSDAMLINNRNRLACKTRVDMVGKKISVAPLPGLPVVKDLIVDMSGFFTKYRSVKPFLINDEPEPERERLQTQKERARFDDTTKCILCAACTTACPSFWARPEYVGPAAIVQAHRFIFDSRDEGAAGTPGDPLRRERRLALPDDLQLRGRLPARHQHHQGDPRGFLVDRHPTRLSGKPKGDSAWESLWGSIGASQPAAEKPSKPAVQRPTAAGGSGVGGASVVARDTGGIGAAGKGSLPAAGGQSALKTFIVRTDGAARGNPGPASSGAVLIDASLPGATRPDAPPIATISEYLGIQTNNVAEYIAVVRALALAEELGARAVDLLLDSKLIVEQLHGRWRVKDAKLIPLHADARTRLARLSRWTANHVPRAQNKQADALCNEAIDRVQSGGPKVVVVRPK